MLAHTRKRRIVAVSGDVAPSDETVHPVVFVGLLGAFGLAMAGIFGKINREERALDVERERSERFGPAARRA